MASKERKAIIADITEDTDQELIPEGNNIGLNKNFDCKIVNNFLPVSFINMFWVLIRTVSLRPTLSTHNICFGWEIRKLIFWYPGPGNNKDYCMKSMLHSF